MSVATVQARPVALEASTASNKLRSSRDIFHQIRWDGTIAAQNVVIGYMDRFLGMQEISFAEFRSNDKDSDYDIPFHRVWYFRLLDGVILWDRKDRIDNLR